MPARRNFHTVMSRRRSGEVAFPSLSVSTTYRWRSDQNVTVTGSGVSSWVDLVASADLVQGTDSRRPAVTANAFGTVQGIDFDGTNDFLTVTATQAHPYTVFLVCDGLGITAADQRFFWASGAAPLLQALANTGQFRMSNTTTFNTGVITDAAVHDYCFVLNSTSSLVYDNASPSVTGNTGTSSMSSATLSVGALASSGNPAAIVIGELAVLNGAITQADATALNAYRVARYGS
jgi:hypothetical protein